VAEQPTCGHGLAHNSVVPAALAGVAAAMARNLELHMAALDRDDAASATEHDVYERIARGLRAAAADLQASAAEMAGARDLPMGAHDMEALTSEAVLDAFERYVAAEAELRVLVEQRAEPNRQMLAAMREAIGAAHDGG